VIQSGSVLLCVRRGFVCLSYFQCVCLCWCVLACFCVCVECVIRGVFEGGYRLCVCVCVCVLHRHTVKRTNNQHALLHTICPNTHKYNPNTQQQPPPQQQQGYAQTAPVAWLPPPPTAGPVGGGGGGGGGSAGGVASWENNYVSALSFLVKLLVVRISRILRPLGFFFGGKLGPVEFRVVFWAGSTRFFLVFVCTTLHARYKLVHFPMY